jgi:23S rRNA pseudouridine1911/1915/1917 synthase
VVYGRVKRARGAIDLALGTDPSDRRRMIPSAAGAPSLTMFERLAHARAPRAGLALLRCTLGTGRRHQIRAHLSARAWPIVGDPVYGGPRWKDVVDPLLAEALHAFGRQALHAFRLSFVHPFTNERVELVSPIPSDMLSLIHAADLTSGVPSANAIER